MNSDVVFRDAVMLALLGFVAMVILMLSHLNPPKENSLVDPAGNIIVQITWPEQKPADVDLWVQGPQDNPVGYSNKSGIVFNLLRDDLGRRNDLTPLNYEFAFSRGLPDGEYIINVHLYSSSGAPLPIEVLAEVSIYKPNRAPVKVVKKTVVLQKVWQKSFTEESLMR